MEEERGKSSREETEEHGREGEEHGREGKEQINQRRSEKHRGEVQFYGREKGREKSS